MAEYDVYGQKIAPKETTTPKIVDAPFSLSYDAYGQPIAKPATLDPSKPITLNTQKELPRSVTESQFRPTTWRDTFRENWAPSVRGIIDGIGGTAGAAGAATLTAPTGPGAVIGGVAGGVGGGAVADELYQQILQRISPSLFGARPEGVGNSVLEAGKEGLYNEVGGRIISGAGRTIGALRPNSTAPFKIKILDKFFPTDPRTSVLQDALKTPEGEALKPTVGQYTQNGAAQAAEDLLANQQKKTIFNTQQQVLKTQAEKQLTDVSRGQYSGIRTAETSPSEIAKTGQQQARDLYFGAKESEKKLWNNLTQETEKFKGHVFIEKEVETPGPIEMTTNGPVQTPTISKKLVPVEIKAPVHITDTASFAQNVSSALENEISETTDKDAITYLTKLKTNVDAFSQPPVDINGKPTLGYLDIKARKDELNRLINDKDMPGDASARIKRQLGLFKALTSKISDDIHNAVNLDWPKDARVAFNRANTKTKNIAEAFYGEKLGSDVIDKDTLQENVLNKALSNPELARQYRMATGGRTELASEFTRKGLDKAFDVEGNFNGETLEKYLTDNGDVAKEALSSDQRNSLLQLARRMRAVDPKLVTSGATALAFKEGTALLALTGGLITGIAKGNISTGAVTSGLILGAVKLSKDVTEKLLLNPKNAYAVGQLAKLPPKSTQAQSLTKMLLKNALSGQILDTDQGQLQVQTDGTLQRIKHDVSLEPAQR